MIAELTGLRKIYSAKPVDIVAVDGIDLSVAEGEIFGLLGPNGAGKTTTISICTTRVRPTSGTVRIHGVDVVKHPSAARRHMGIVPQYNTLDRSLTIFENVYYHCRYFGMNAQASRERSNALLSQFHLGERTKAFPHELSGGLQQRVQIARAIAHHPAVLFLDEPSAGLDPQSRIAMWDAVSALRNEGITVVLTTHYMEEADALCDRVAIIDHGRVLALESPDTLKRVHGATVIVDLKLRSVEGVETLRGTLMQLPSVQTTELLPDGVRVLVTTTDELLPSLVQAAAPFGLRDLAIREPSLETVFLQLTGRELRD